PVGGPASGAGNAAGTRPAVCRRLLSSAGFPRLPRRLRLERFHVSVGKAEVVADLMDQHVGDDGPQRLLVLGPVVEDGAAIEPDLVGQLARRLGHAELRAPQAAEEAQQIELGFDAKLVERLVIGELGDGAGNPLRQAPERLRQALEGVARDRLELVEGGRHEPGPVYHGTRATARQPRKRGPAIATGPVSAAATRGYRRSARRWRRPPP